MATAEESQNGHWLAERTKPPFLRRVRIQGYKSIALCDVRLQPMTILVGRNGSGKSNFLDALAFLRDSMEYSVSDAFKRRGGWASVACRSPASPQIIFEIEVGFLREPFDRRGNGSHLHTAELPGKRAQMDLADDALLARYYLELARDQYNIPIIHKEMLEIQGLDTQAGIGFEVRDGLISRWRSREGVKEPIQSPLAQEFFTTYRPDRPLLGVIGTQPFISLGEGLREMGFYNFYPEAIRRLQKPAPGVLLERDGSNLASVIEGLKEISPDAITRIRDYLVTIVEDVDQFDAVQYGEYNTVRFQLRPSGPATLSLGFDAASMSDGTLRSLAALMAVFQIHLPVGPIVVGIEEPETSLHPAATQALVDALEEATGQTQVLLTTHSGDLLADRQVEPGQVLVVRMRNGQTQIAPVDPASREILRKELYTLADLQRMGQLDLDEADLQRQAEVLPSGGGN